MPKRLPSDVYADLVAVGFTPQAAVTLTAISGGESGYDTTSLGDLNLQDVTWGPSFGLYQIRTLKSDTGRGTVRDIQWLAASPTNQAKAALAISHGGSDFTPWTVYTTGVWRNFLSTATSAATVAGNVITGGDGGPFPTWGPSWLPWNWPSNAANAASAQLLGGARNIVLEALAVGLGLAVAGVGLAVALRPVTRRARQAATTATKVAVL